MFKFPFVALNLVVCSSLTLSNLLLPVRAQKWLPVREGSSTITVPWPRGNLRHISGLKVDSAEIVYTTAAKDTGYGGAFPINFKLLRYFKNCSSLLQVKFHCRSYPSINSETGIFNFSCC